MFEAAVAGGAAALGALPAGLTAGASADIVSLRSDHPVLAGREGDAIIDAWIFAGSSDAVDCVWVRGDKRVDAGRHKAREEVGVRFVATMLRLAA
jgi:cytosine/adenosine deaminase-related metal-dependent hydrolase